MQAAQYLCIGQLVEVLEVVKKVGRSSIRLKSTGENTRASLRHVSKAISDNNHPLSA